MNINGMIKRLTILLTILICTACVDFHPRINPDPGYDSFGEILYCSESEVGQEIYIISADGLNPVALTDAPQGSHNCEDLVWHPNGTQIAFLSDRDNKVSQVHQVNLDGSGLLNLTDMYNVGRDFSWSPDGEFVTFTTSDGIYTMQVDGSGRRKIHSYGMTIPYWSPNGQFIAFGAKEDSVGVIYVINADGTGLRKVAQSRGENMYTSLYLDWSPDSEKIAFRNMLDENNYEIAIANQDGSGEFILTGNPAKDDRPSWSPDGLHIVFYSDRDGNLEIYKMSVDGSNQIRLTYNTVADVTPKWSSDGTKIAYISGDWGKRQVFIMNADGSEQTQLTHDEGSKCCINWLP